jgi:C4-dicarboxylate-specific signal transduction histidine kinase
VELHLPDGLPPTHGDRIQLEQVVFNLLQNAIESVAARSAGPRLVCIETTADGDTITVRVRDSGVGLSDPERVFEENVPGGAEFAFTLPAHRGGELE